MSTSGSKSNEHVAHFLVDIHSECRDKQIVALPLNNEQFVQIVVLRKRNIQMSEMGKRYLEALKNVLKEYIN